MGSLRPTPVPGGTGRRSPCLKGSSGLNGVRQDRAASALRDGAEGAKAAGAGSEGLLTQLSWIPEDTWLVQVLVLCSALWVGQPEAQEGALSALVLAVAQRGQAMGVAPCSARLGAPRLCGSFISNTSLPWQMLKLTQRLASLEVWATEEPNTFHLQPYVSKPVYLTPLFAK